jgi:RimJ/RimL family protein N-acetyltransferase
MLIRQEILSIPRLGAVNIHGALLPQYRGCNPIQWALLNNESETGPTMHYMATEFDAGDIIAQRRVPIHIHDTWCDVLKRIGESTEVMLAEQVPKLLDQTNHREAQDEAISHYYRRRHPEDGLIDWNQQSVLHIYNLVRALVSPHPGAFYFQESEKVVLDQYLTIPQVASLKYGVAGGQSLRGEYVRLRPPSQIRRLLESPWPKGSVQLMSTLVPVTLPEAEMDGDYWRQNDCVMFEVCLRNGEETGGLVMLRALNFIERTAELCLRLYQPDSGELVRAAETIRLAMQFAFNELGMVRLKLHVDGTDGRSVKLLESLGFSREGAKGQPTQMNGKCVDSVTMGLVREPNAQ